MKRILALLLLSILFNLVIQGQDSFCKFGLKGKALPWVVGNMGGLHGFIGAEYGFFQRHSIGLDFYIHGIQDHHDQYYGPNDPRNKPSLDYNSLNKTIFLNYRYYFSSVYVGAFGLTGQKISKMDRGFSNDSLLRETRDFKGIGLLIGYKHRFKKHSRLGFDFNLGGFFNMLSVDSKKYNGPETYDSSANFRTYDMRVGFNLFWFIID